jgi:NAD(P)-dependent dehydrogenase (short-subunit alcohol dehydrogenase family)
MTALDGVAVSGRTALVVGASRGLGRGIASGLAQAGAAVVAVARNGSALAELAASNANIRIEATDAAVATTANRLVEQYEPTIVVLVAGSSPFLAPLQEQTWETFSLNWHADVQIAFHWLRAALLKPLRPGSRVIVISSGAALAGSPLSGGYAGAKATQRLITGYAHDEAQRSGLDVCFTAVLPRITPLTDLGRPAVQAYARRSGQTEQQYRDSLGELLTPEVAGAAVIELIRTDTASIARSYLLTGAGLQVLP